MRTAKIYFCGIPAGRLFEEEGKHRYIFGYLPDYTGPAISLTMPLRKEDYEFDRFPPFFDGLLPEGIMLDGLLRSLKIDRNDYFSQLIAVGHDLVGAVTVEKENE